MIRKCNSSDIKEINNLGSKYYSNFLNIYNLEEYINDSNYLIIVFEDDNIIKGFAISTFMYGEIELLFIYVRENYRRQRIGSALLEYLINCNTQRILLEVSVENKNAIKLYEKYNFRTINVRKGYYHGVDALVMEMIN